MQTRAEIYKITAKKTFDQYKNEEILGTTSDNRICEGRELRDGIRRIVSILRFFAVKDGSECVRLVLFQGLESCTFHFLHHYLVETRYLSNLRNCRMSNYKFKKWIDREMICSIPVVTFTFFAIISPKPDICPV